MKTTSDFFIENIWLIAAVLMSGGMLFWPLLQSRGRKVTLLQATQMMNQGKTLIVDVRSSEDFAKSYIRGAINIPVKDLAGRVSELEKHKNKNVIVVCQAGTQSSGARAQLENAGFKEVYSLEGGLAAWEGQGLPVAR